MSTPDDEARLIGWELLAMTATSHRLRNDSSLRDDPLAHTAFLESFLVHVRVLIEFFMGRVGDDGSRRWKPKTDLVPADLCPGWLPAATSQGELLDAALPKIDAFLSHLSRQRLDESEAWGFVGLAEAILAVAALFDAELTRARATHAKAFHEQLFLATQMLAQGPIN